MSNNKILEIAVDCGFSSSKITVANTFILDIPSQIVNISNENALKIGTKKPGYIETYLQSSKGNVYVIGKAAVQKIAQNEASYSQNASENEKVNLTFDRFTSAENTIYLHACIAQAMIEYSEYCKKHKTDVMFDIDEYISNPAAWKIYLVLGFPHSEFEEIFKRVKISLDNPIGLHIKTVSEVSNELIEKDITFKVNVATAYSQGLASLMSVVLDEDGYAIEDSEIYDNRPLLIIEAGQKTVAIYVYTASDTIESEESNTDFAMYNVYESMIEQIKKTSEHIKISVTDIATRMENNNTNVRYTVPGEGVKEIDLKDFYAESLENACTDLIEYVNNKFSYLQDMNGILVAGGTGKAYYEQIKKILPQTNPFIKDSINLATFKHKGQTIEPRYAITVGLAKVLHQFVIEDTEAN